MNSLAGAFVRSLKSRTTGEPSWWLTDRATTVAGAGVWLGPVRKSPLTISPAIARHLGAVVGRPRPSAVAIPVATPPAEYRPARQPGQRVRQLGGDGDIPRHAANLKFEPASVVRPSHRLHSPLIVARG